MAHVQRPSGIGRYEFDLRLLATAHRDPAECLTLLQRLTYDSLLRSRLQE